MRDPRLANRPAVASPSTLAPPVPSKLTSSSITPLSQPPRSAINPTYSGVVMVNVRESRNADHDDNLPATHEPSTVEDDCRHVPTPLASVAHGLQQSIFLILR